MALTPSDIKTRFAEFASLDDARIQIWVDVVADIICKSAYLASSVADLAEYLLVAHYVQTYEVESADSKTAIGSVQSMSAGDLSIQFASSGRDTDLLESTKYGAMYNRLSAVFPPRVF